MTQRQKREKKLFRNPKIVTFNELKQVLVDNGFIEKRSGAGTSHHVFKRDGKTITVPYRRPYVKEVYVKIAIVLLGEINE